MPNPFGQMVDTSCSDGMNIKNTWARFFRENQDHVTRGEWDKVKTDEELLKGYRCCFPQRDVAQASINVVRWRSAYNRGALSEGELPLHQSKRYIKDGVGMFVATPRGKFIERVKGYKEKHHGSQDVNRTEKSTGGESQEKVQRCVNQDSSPFKQKGENSNYSST